MSGGKFDRKRADAHARKGTDDLRAKRGAPPVTDREWQQIRATAAEITAKIIKDAKGQDKKPKGKKEDKKKK